jgi:hypothetical protein
MASQHHTFPLKTLNHPPTEIHIFGDTDWMSLFHIAFQKGCLEDTHKVPR